MILSVRVASAFPFSTNHQGSSAMTTGNGRRRRSTSGVNGSESKSTRETVATKQDKLTAERLRERLHYDAETGVFTRRFGSGHARAGDMAGTVHRTGYVRISIDGGKYTAHHLAWLYVHGVWPSDQIEHINRKRSDNRIANLRERRAALRRPTRQTEVERDAYFASLVAERKQRFGW